MSEIKSCPFCGATHEHATDFRWNKPALKIHHKEDCVFNQGDHVFCAGIPDHDDYIARWNRRADSELRDALIDIEAIANGTAKDFSEEQRKDVRFCIGAVIGAARAALAKGGGA